MTKEIELAGVKHPIRFGMAALLMYEDTTGRAAIADFSGIANAGDVKLSVIVDLIYAGLSCGYRSVGMKMNFDRYEVADWLTDEETAIEDVLKLFTESFPKSKNAAPLTQKKAKA